MNRRTFLATTAATLAGSGTAAASHRSGDSDALADAAQPFEPLDSLSLPKALELKVGDDGETYFVATGEGFATVDASDPRSLSLSARVDRVLTDHADGPLHGVFDLAVDGDRLLVAGPAHSPDDGDLTAIVLFDVSDPASPERIAFREVSHGTHNCDLVDGTAYCSGTGLDDTPLLTYDVTGDAITELGRWSPIDHDERWADVPPVVRPCHDVTVHGDRAVGAWWDAGTFLLDVSDPAAPTAITQVGGGDPADLAGLSGGDKWDALFELPGNSHYAALSPDGDLLAVGREAWDESGTERTGGPGGIDLYDVADPDGPTHQARIAPPSTSDPTRGGVTTTSHNFGFRGRTLLTSWYRGGVRAYDVSDPTAVTRTAAWRDAATTTFWTAVPAARCVAASSYLDHTLDSPREGARIYTFPRVAPGPAVGGSPATDPDGDGRFEDVNGDGSSDVVDIQSLFSSLDDPAVGNEFDFNGDGSVNVVDVQRLFSDLT